MFEASRALAAIPGLQTELELRWLPSHMGGHKVDMHEQADRHCARVWRERRPICLVDGVEAPLSMEEGVYFELRGPFERRVAAVAASPRRAKRPRRESRQVRRGRPKCEKEGGDAPSFKRGRLG